MGKAVVKNQKNKKVGHRYVINCSQPLEDNVLVLSDFESFMNQRIKVEGKVGNLGQAVVVSKDGASLVVEAKIPFSKRYLKYLSKKYLKKQELREYLRVVATKKNEYELRFFTLNNDEGADE